MYWYLWRKCILCARSDSFFTADPWNSDIACFLYPMSRRPDWWISFRNVCKRRSSNEHFVQILLDGKRRNKRKKSSCRNPFISVEDFFILSRRQKALNFFVYFLVSWKENEEGIKFDEVRQGVSNASDSIQIRLLPEKILKRKGIQPCGT